MKQLIKGRDRLQDRRKTYKPDGRVTSRLYKNLKKAE